MAHVASDVEMHDMEGVEHRNCAPSIPISAKDHLLPDELSMTSPSFDDRASGHHSMQSAYASPMLPKGEDLSQDPNLIHEDERSFEPRKAALDGRWWRALWRCTPHILPLSVTIFIIVLNVAQAYWQDLGRPHQTTRLQAWQYAAKAHELLMASSITAIAVHRIQYDLCVSKGVPLGFVSAGYQLSDPLFVFSKEWLGGVTSFTHPKGLTKAMPLGILLLLGFGLTVIVGPSSAVVMIPQLDWWDVPKPQVFGDIPERPYMNFTAAQLWVPDITNDLYNQEVDCPNDKNNQDCPTPALDLVGGWVAQHQNQGLQPNITVAQDGGVTRYLTSVGGPYDESSWTVTSTIGWRFARDLGSFWEWMVERNTSLAQNISRPLITPSFTDPSLKMRKPLVQAQCQTYFNPDWNATQFEFPHDQLKTPPLDEFLDKIWTLPNSFVKDLVGDNRSPGYIPDDDRPKILFDWYDTATNFSTKGAPSLGAVVIASTTNENETMLAACSFDGRWAPVKFYLDPRTDPTIRQDSPDPMDILKRTSQKDLRELKQINMHLDWANSLNFDAPTDNDPKATAVIQLLEGLGNINAYNHWAIYPETPKDQKSLAWRISTTLGLLLTEALAHAYQDGTRSSVVYHDAPISKYGVNESYVRPLNDLNVGDVTGWSKSKNKTTWVDQKDPTWNDSIPSWDVWAPQNGYTEMKITVQRYGYGYGFNGVPIILATTALSLYGLLAIAHMILIILGRRTFNGFSGMSEMLALAWNSNPAQGLRNTSAGIDRTTTWKQVVRVREREGKQLQLVLGDARSDDGENDGKIRRRPAPGVLYA